MAHNTLTELYTPVEVLATDVVAQDATVGGDFGGTECEGSGERNRNKHVVEGLDDFASRTDKRLIYM